MGLIADAWAQAAAAGQSNPLVGLGSFLLIMIGVLYIAAHPPAAEAGEGAAR